MGRSRYHAPTPTRERAPRIHKGRRPRRPGGRTATPRKLPLGEDRLSNRADPSPWRRVGRPRSTGRMASESRRELQGTPYGIRVSEPMSSTRGRPSGPVASVNQCPRSVQLVPRTRCSSPPLPLAVQAAAGPSQHADDGVRSADPPLADLLVDDVRHGQPRGLLDHIECLTDPGRRYGNRPRDTPRSRHDLPRRQRRGAPPSPSGVRRGR